MNESYRLGVKKAIAYGVFTGGEGGREGGREAGREGGEGREGGVQRYVKSGATRREIETKGRSG